MVVKDSVSEAVLLSKLLHVTEVDIEVGASDNIDAKECKACNEPFETVKYRVGHLTVLLFALNKLLIIREFKENSEAG